jgi:uncharacterized membrane protein YdjX (TVP38/TMEM64 family)
MPHLTPAPAPLRPQTADAAAEGGFRWGLVRRPVLLVAGLIAAAVALREAPGGLDIGLVDRFVSGHGLAGELVFLLAGAGLCAVGLPRQAVAFGGGYAFGLWGGAALGLLAQGLGCAASFGWARVVARDWAARRVRGRIARVDGFLAANPFAATLTLRLLPVGSNLALNLLAGVSGVGAAPFLAASVIGYLPQTAVFALLGAGVRVEAPVQLGLGLALFCGSGLLGIVLLRRQRRAAAVAAATVATAPLS